MFDWSTNVLSRAAHWMEEYNGAVTAVGTVVIAAFTIVLAIVSRRQAVLTRKSVEIAERAVIATERAFVFLDDFVPMCSVYPLGGSLELRRFEIKPRWRNSGTTPTRNMRIRVNWTHWPSDQILTGIGVYGEDTKPARMFLGPQAAEWSEAIKIPDQVATAALQGKECIMIWGRVDYEDIFAGTSPHFTEWCYRLNIGAEGGQVQTQFVAFSDYNRSDEDARKDIRSE